MELFVDDVGSFPLPPYVDRKMFNEAYVLAREAIIQGKDIKESSFLFNNFYRVVVDSFRMKLETGLDIVNYPQHYDINRQFADLICKAMNEGTYLVDERNAVIPEVYVISEEAKRLFEEYGEKIHLRVCVTGPLELYLKEVGTIVYRDILLMFAETVRRFAKNSILNTKYLKTEVVALDEPSLGFQEFSTEKDVILEILEKAFDFSGVIKQIHLHSTSSFVDVLQVKNLNILSFEFAASPKNIEAIPRKMLDTADKQVRVGISRTDIDSIVAELYERGITKPTVEQLVESEEIIRKRFMVAKEKYGNRMKFTGPDCGLGGWPTQEAAQLLLKRTANAVRSVLLES